MKQIQLLYSNEVMLEDERILKLDYSLIQKCTSANQEIPYYGVKVTKKLDNMIETEEIAGISSSKETVLSIIRKLCRFEVTPISLVEIVDDLVTQGM